MKLSLDKLDDIWQTASKQQISTESKNTFCCVKMLTTWYETSDKVTANAIIMATDAPNVDLKTKISSVEALLTSEYVPIESNVKECVTNPLEKLKQPYFEMITNFCLELSKSQKSFDDILMYLKVCKINLDILEKISDFPELMQSFESHELLSKTDLSWLRVIAHYAQCMEAIKVVEKYENLLIADKIQWYSNPKGTYLVVKTEKRPEDVTIKYSSDVKSTVSEIVNIKETDSILNSSEVGSVTFYLKLVNKDITIQIPNVSNSVLIKKCKDADITHIGIMTDGSLNLATIDEIGTLYYLCALIS